MYLPKSKYQVKNTIGGELFHPNGSDYIGSFIETYSGEIYTGSTLGKKSTRLIDVREVNEFDSNPVRFVNDFIKPNDKDYTNEKFNRYFIQDKRTKSIIEVNSFNYKRMQSLVYTIPVKIEWILKGPVADTNKGPYIYFGAGTHNKESVLDAEKTIPNLSQIINNYAEFVV